MATVSTDFLKTMFDFSNLLQFFLDLLLVLLIGWVVGAFNLSQHHGLFQ